MNSSICSESISQSNIISFQVEQQDQGIQSYHQQKIPNYTLYQLQHLSICNLNLWKDIGVFNLPPPCLVDISSSLSTIIQEQTQQNHDIHKDCIDYCMKAGYEIKSLNEMIQYLHPSKQIRNSTSSSLVNASLKSIYRTISKEDINLWKLPPTQSIELKQNIFKRLHSHIHQSLEEMKQKVNNRNIYIQQLHHLSKYWNLREVNNKIFIDTSYTGGITSSTGGNSNTAGSNSSDNIQLSLNKDNCLEVINKKIYYTLQLSLVNTSSSSLECISCIRGWNSSMKHTSNKHINSSLQSLQSIHDICLQSQHGNYIQELFMKLRNEASSLKLFHRNFSFNSNASMNMNTINLIDDRFNNDINILYLNHNKIIIEVSTCISLIIEMIPIDLDFHSIESSYDSLLEDIWFTSQGLLLDELKLQKQCESILTLEESLRPCHITMKYPYLNNILMNLTKHLAMKGSESMLDRNKISYHIDQLNHQHLDNHRMKIRFENGVFIVTLFSLANMRLRCIVFDTIRDLEGFINNIPYQI